MAKSLSRRACKAPLTGRRDHDAPWRKRRGHKARLLSEKEALLRKLLWKERELRSAREKELECCRRTAEDLRIALHHALRRTPEVVTSDPYFTAQ